MPQVQHTGRSTAKALERADEVKADADREETNKAQDDKKEAKHASKAHHAHHAHLAKPKTQQRTPGHHGHDPHEAAHAAHMAEAMGWGPDSAAEAEDKKAEADDAHAEEQREKEGNPAARVQVTAKATVPTGKSETAHDNKKDAFQKLPNPATGGKGAGAKGGSEIAPPHMMAQVKQAAAVSQATAASTTDAVRQAAERALASGKPLDAFALLNMAQPPGVFFKENDGNDSGAGEDPELAAAVEEMIKVLFGVRGIMRVAAGRNQAEEPVVLVVVGAGFGEASLRAVPEKISRFPTLLALPFDVLPLKKER